MINLIFDTEIIILSLNYTTRIKRLICILTILRSQLAGIHLTFQNKLEPLYLSTIFPCVRRIPEKKINYNYLQIQL